MLSEVKSFMSPDIIDLNNYYPENDDSFSFLITVLVGSKGDTAMESFDILVCTPQWIINKYSEDEMLLGSYKLIVLKFDMVKILARIKKLFDNCEGKDWQEIAIKLSRIGRWEFENYQH